MCSTCEDKSSTNPDLCGAALAARREEAHRVVKMRDKGTKYAEIAEELGCSKARVYKLFGEGMEVVNRDKRAEVEYILQQFDDQIDDARQDMDALTIDPEARCKARANWLALVKEKAKLMNLYPPKERIVRNSIEFDDDYTTGLEPLEMGRDS